MLGAGDTVEVWLQEKQSEHLWSELQKSSRGALEVRMAASGDDSSVSSVVCSGMWCRHHGCGAPVRLWYGGVQKS